MSTAKCGHCVFYSRSVTCFQTKKNKNKEISMKTLLLSLCLGVSSLSAFLLANDAETKSNPGQVKVVILLGPPGSGKGTQAVRLTKELGIPHISTGDLFRENMSKDTELGQRAKSFINAGKLVPDELVLEMLFDRVSRPDCAKGYLLDGFPRTLAQAEALEKHLAPNTDLVVLDLEVPDEIIVKRASGRLTCKDCASVYNRYFSPPAKEGVCDKCGGELVQRPDDRAEVVEERLRVYHSQTKPLVDFYAKKGVLKRVDGTQSPDQVFEALKGKLSVPK
jgi:adenylate kinase